MKKIVVLQGHPDPSGNRLCHALGEAYTQAAAAAGHDVRPIDVARLEFPILRSQDDWMSGRPGTPKAIVKPQADFLEMDHLVMIFPLWMGDMPALLKAFLEQTLRPGVALDYGERWPKPLMTGKSARIIVTMGMPALAYRWYFGAHSLRSLERNILKLTGFGPVRETLFGLVEGATDRTRQGWLEKVRRLGRDGA